MRELRQAARRQKVSVAEWVRAALRTRRGERDSAATAAHKLEAVRRAARFAFPTADIDRMLDEIGRGYGAGEP